MPPDCLFFSHSDFWHGEATNMTNPTTGETMTADMQMEVRGQAAAAYQITLVMSQASNYYKLVF